MKGQKIKEYQQKEPNLMLKTFKKTRNYIISCRATNAQQKPRKLAMRKLVIIDLGRQIETRYD